MIYKIFYILKKVRKKELYIICMYGVHICVLSSDRGTEENKDLNMTYKTNIFNVHYVCSIYRNIQFSFQCFLCCHIQSQCDMKI